MSWIERVKNDLTITCGDGGIFTPLWKKATKVKEYNTTQFDYNNVEGSFVVRKRPRGAKYNLEVYFTGDSNIEQSNAFQLSADDSRAWVISHPLYDRIVVQPLSMNIDNTKQNVTKFTISVIETIQDENPKESIEPTEEIVRLNEVASVSLVDEYASNNIPDVEDKAEMRETNYILYDNGVKIANDTVDFENYFNLFNKANAAVINATSDAISAMRTAQALVNAPALFVGSVRSRLTAFEDQFNQLIRSTSNTFRKSSLSYYESMLGGIVSGMAITLVTSIDYRNRNDVLAASDTLNSIYDRYVANLDDFQSDSNNSPDSYIPSFDNQKLINDLVNLTISSLSNIATNARQERSIILEQDDNVINLAHRFYGLELDDSTIDDFQETNNIGIDEIMGLKKGRTIVYFV